MKHTKLLIFSTLFFSFLSPSYFVHSAGWSGDPYWDQFTYNKKSVHLVIENGNIYIRTNDVNGKIKLISTLTDDTAENDNMQFDMDSLRILDKNLLFFSDKNKVYYATSFSDYNFFHELEGADPNTFVVLNYVFQKDDKHIYYFEYANATTAGPDSWNMKIKILQGVDLGTFKIFNSPGDQDDNYAIDKNNMYYKGKVVKKESIAIKNRSLHNRLKGRIILTVESGGEAYYISPDKQEMYYLGTPMVAFQVMRERGIGITNNNLEKIPVEGNCPFYDSSCDKNRLHDMQFARSQKGKIFLQVQRGGEGWYVDPLKVKRYYLGKPSDVFYLMRSLSLGISKKDFQSLTN